VGMGIAGPLRAFWPPSCLAFVDVGVGRRRPGGVGRVRGGGGGGSHAETAEVGEEP